MLRRLVAPACAIVSLLCCLPAYAGPFAYLLNDGDSTTTVVDLGTNAVVTTIDTAAAGCTRARGAALSPSGLRLYESCLLSNNVAVIDTVTNSVVTTMALPGLPFPAPDGLAVHPVQPRLYAADFQGLTVFDTGTNTVVTTIPLTVPIGYDQVEGVAVNHAGTRVYTSQVFSSLVNVIDTATNTEIATVPLAGSRGIAIDPTDARVYVGGSSGGGIDVNVIDAATNTIVDTISMGFACGSITSIVLDPAGATLYAACRNHVAVADVVTHAVTLVPVGFNVFGLDITRDGARVVAVNEGDNTVSVVDTATNTAGAPITVGTSPYSYPGTFVGPTFTCGNNVREPGEACDGTPCCTSSCTADVGAACNDGDGCTTGDVCNGSAVCAGTPLDCDDGDTCTADLCSPFTQACAHVPTPKALGGDDAGCVPPDKATAKCEDGVAKNAAKLVLAALKCTVKASAAGVKGVPFDAAACETAAAGKYDLKTGALKACPACIDAAAVRTAVLAQADGAAVAALYCDPTSGTPLGAGGFVPKDKTTAKCQDGAAKALAKLVGAVVKCHTKLADAKLKAAPFDEEACETAAVGKFDAAGLKLAACPTCLTPLLPGLGTATAAGLDLQNAQTFCASPSGAFVSGSTAD